MWCHSDLIFHADTVNSIAVCLGLAKGDRKKSVLRDTTLSHNPKKRQIARDVRYFQLKGIFKGTLFFQISNSILETRHTRYNRPMEPPLPDKRMQRLATGMLITMLVILILANLFLSAHPRLVTSALLQKRR